MVKKGSQPSNEVHPLLKTLPKMDEFLKRQEAKEARQAFQIEELEKWKACLTWLASTEQGQLFLRSMLQHSGMFQPGSIRDTLGMVEDKCRASFYIEWVRPYLDPSVRKDIEP